MMVKPFVRIGTIIQANPIVDSAGRPTATFMTALNNAFANLAEALNTLAALPEIQEALSQVQGAVEAANDAAENAQNAADATKREAALTNSYIDPATVISATPTTITIASHVRRYADGTSANITGSTRPATAIGDTDYVYYDDPTRVGGAVNFIVSTTAPVQTGNRHVVEAVLIPTIVQGTASGGGGPAPPGKVLPKAATA